MPCATKVIDNVPNYLWNYGCAPTSGGMVAAYYNNKYNGLFVGKMLPTTDLADRDGDGQNDQHDSAPANRVDVDGMPYRQGTRGTGPYSAQNPKCARQNYLYKFYRRGDSV